MPFPLVFGYSQSGGEFYTISIVLACPLHLTLVIASPSGRGNPHALVLASHNVMWQSSPRVATKSSACYLPAAIRNFARTSSEAVPSASRGKGHFLKLAGDTIQSILGIQFQDVFQGFRKASQQFFSAFFLGIGSEHLLDPSNPPVTVLLDNRRKVSIHPNNLTYHLPDASFPCP